MAGLPLTLDHVLVAVADLDRAAADFDQRHGLRSVEGGRHPGVGTANRIVPLGTDYIELIAVVDQTEAANNWRGRRVADAVARGETFAGWALRTTDLEAFRKRCQSLGMPLPPPSDGSRRKPDGTLLRWRVQELHEDAEVGAVPFVIEWQVPDAEHPAAQLVEQPSGAGGIARVVVGATSPEAEGQLRKVIGDGVPFEVRRSKRNGIIEVALSSRHGEVVIT
jgi:Glyoxalase-like domain